MTAPPLTAEYLTGRDEDGIALVTPIPCTVQGDIRRTMGTHGDELTVLVAITDWPIADLDKSKPFDVTFGDAGVPLVLGGYILQEDRPATFGENVPADSGGDVSQMIELRFVTLLGTLKEGRGGLLREKTFNPVKSDGLVDDAHADYKTNLQLAVIALDALGVPYDAPPTTMNELHPPSALDWGNCRALPELESLCARCGHAICLSNDGTTIRIVRLPQPGEEVEIPIDLPDESEPFELRAGPPVRAKSIIVTSGRTRTTIVTDLELSDMEWVWFDPITKRWLNDAQTATEYPGTMQPGDITKLRVPPKTPAERKEYNRLFTALRVTGENLPKVKKIVNLSAAAELDNGSVLHGAPAIAYAMCSTELVSGQLRNVPSSDEDDPVRLDGVRAIANEGVFIMPKEAIIARLGDTAGGYGDLSAIDGDQLYVLFAHESNRGDEHDYFRVGYKAEMSSGRVVATEMTEEEFEDALADINTVTIEADFLKHLLVWPKGETDPTESNTDDLKVQAQKLARIRAAADYAQSGEIHVHGLQDLAPGDYGGAVTSVAWSTTDRATTVVINEHEAPDGAMSSIESDSERSFVTGLRRFANPGSSVSLSDVRNGSAPSTIANNGATAAQGEPGAMSGTRGREESHPITQLSTPPAPQMNRRGDAATFYAKITGNTSLSDNKWSYNFEEVYLDDSADWVTVSGGRTHTTHGTALNTLEANNSSSGVQGNGIDLANLPPEYEIQPIANGGVHRMEGPLGAPGAQHCVFSCPNGVDGVCE